MGASILGRENASHNGAKAGLATSTSTRSMSTSTQLAVGGGTQVLWRRPFGTAAAARQKLQTSEAVAGESFCGTSTQLAVGGDAQVLWRRPSGTAAASRKKPKTSEAAAGLSYGAPATIGVWCVCGRQF